MKKLIILFICITAGGFATQAQLEYKLQNSHVQIAGTSTLHDWTADVTKSNGLAELNFSNGKLTSIENLNITMETKTIKSKKGAAMDKNMYKALKTDRYPTLSFTMTKVAQVSANKVNAEGKLTIAGTTQTVTIQATSKSNANGEWIFSGSKLLKMTDYQVEPPVVLLGTLKTGNEITITFEMTFSPATGLSQR